MSVAAPTTQLTSLSNFSAQGSPHTSTQQEREEIKAVTENHRKGADAATKKMALPDTTFCLFFRTHPEAACLACDGVGVSHEELLFIHEDLFIASAPSRDVGLLQFNLRERQRQDLFRRLFLARQELIAEGSVQQRWEERRRLFPLAQPPPNVKALMAAGRDQQRAMGIEPHRRRHSGDGSGGRRRSSSGGGMLRGGRFEPDEGEEAFDTESEEDDLDEFYQPKPKPPPLSAGIGIKGHPSYMYSSSGGVSPPNSRKSSSSAGHSLRHSQQNAAAKKTASNANNNNNNNRHHQQQRNGSRSPVMSPRQVAAATFPQPPTGPPPAPSRTADTLVAEARAVRVAKQRLRQYAHEYASEEVAFSERQRRASEAAMAKSANNQTLNRPSSSASSTTGGGMRLTYGSEGGGGAGHSASAVVSHNNTTLASSTASPLVRLPAVPDAGRTAERLIRNLIAATLTDVVSEAGLQRRAADEAAEGVERERRGEFTLNTVRCEYPSTPSPGFGHRSPASARGQHWASRRGELVASEARAATARLERLEEKWERKRGVIEAAEAEKMNPHRLNNEAAKMRSVLASERREGVTTAKENEMLRGVARRSPRHAHAERVQEARRAVAAKNKETHERLMLYRKAIEEERQQMGHTKRYGVPDAVRALWDANSDTLSAPALGVRGAVPSNLQPVVEGAVAASEALLSGGSVSLAGPNPPPYYTSARGGANSNGSGNTAGRMANSPLSPPSSSRALVASSSHHHSARLSTATNGGYPSPTPPPQSQQQHRLSTSQSQRPVSRVWGDPMVEQ